jgi:hypothetical protein
MNPLNYGSPEASQRLHAKGIVLETDFYWVRISETQWVIQRRDSETVRDLILGIAVPAPLMTEVLRALPKQKTFIQKGEEFYICFLADWKHDEGELSHLEYHSGLFFADNPTDALIDLLIWVTEQRKEEGNELSA